MGTQAGCGDVTSLHKNLVKKRKTNRRQAIQEPIFSVASADFEGGCDGRGCGARHFFWPDRPNPAMAFLTVALASLAGTRDNHCAIFFTVQLMHALFQRKFSGQLAGRAR